MKIDQFRLERFFLEHETAGVSSLSSAICEPLSLRELLALSNGENLGRLFDLKLGYTDSYGRADLREAVAALYTDVIRPGNVIEVEPTEGILVALNCLLEPGDHVIASYPLYEPFYRVAKAIQCDFSYWQANVTGWQFDPDELEALIKPGRTKLIIINFPHNPTGANLTHCQLSKVIDLARRYEITLFSDELFRWSEQDETTRLPAVCDVYEKGITLSGMSKSFSLPGIRVGWLATQDKRMIEQFSIFKDYTTGSPSASSEVLALIALDAKDRIIERTLGIVETNLEILESFFADFEDKLRWVRPNSSLVTLVELRSGKLDEFAEALRNKEKILIAPSSVLLLDHLEHGSNYFRLGFGLRNLPQTLDRFKQFLKTSW